MANENRKGTSAKGIKLAVLYVTPFAILFITEARLPGYTYFQSHETIAPIFQQISHSEKIIYRQAMGKGDVAYRIC